MITFALNVLISIGIFIAWLLYGRDPKDNRVLVRMYDPPKDVNGKDMTPLEMGTVVDEYLHSHDISAEIINLAIQKYIKIHEEEKSTLGVFKSTEVVLSQGEKLKANPQMSELKQHQKDIIKALGLDNKEIVKITNNTEIYPEIEKIYGKVYSHLTEEGYFPRNPDVVRKLYLVIGFVLMFVTLFIPGIVVILLSFFMSRKTIKGLEAKRHALGLKQFLESQDRQFEFQEKNFYLFEKLLPYAINFGVAKIWAKKFEDITNYKPDWYTTNANSLNTFALVNSLQNNLGTIESSYRSSSSSGFSSGGGFSGGGGGGGGGGSW